MIKKLIPFLLIVATFFMVARPVFAADVLTPVCDNPNKTEDIAICNDANPDEDPIFGKNGAATITLSIASIVLAVIAIFVIIIAGLRIITAAGDSHTISSARNQILYAVIGLVVAAIAQGIVQLVLSKVP
ncbi:hypothetical protein KC951_02940 [Candidatus Saccharibacteria bacterium]|nr:hypothetical protein [Candidatus Saccharibacteria bacterium]